jgi:hypothetical protein
MARSLLTEIMQDNRSEDKGITLMHISANQGSYVPFLWDNHVHGALHVALSSIVKTKLAISELEDAGILQLIEMSGSQSQWALQPDYYP